MSWWENPWLSCTIDNWFLWTRTRRDIDSLLTIPEAWEIIDQRKIACNGLRDEILQSMDESQRIEYLKIYAQLTPEKIMYLNNSLQEYRSLKNLPADIIFNIFFDTDKVVWETEVRHLWGVRVIRSWATLNLNELFRISTRPWEDANAGPFIILDDNNYFHFIDPRIYRSQTENLIANWLTTLISSSVDHWGILAGISRQIIQSEVNSTMRLTDTLNQIFQ